MSLRERVRLLRDRLLLRPPQWEYAPGGWRPEGLAVRGWDDPSAAEVELARWPAFLRALESAAPLGDRGETAAVPCGLPSHNVLMTYAYVLALAARGRERLSFLDWGGGIGRYYRLAKALLPELELDYHCKDFPAMAEQGARLSPEQRFHSDEACLESRYGLVMALSSIHFEADWRGRLEKLARATARGGYLFLNQYPVALRVPSFVFIQRPRVHGYRTEFLGWCLNRGEVLACAESAGLALVREFRDGYTPPIARAPEECEYRGFLFRRPHA